MLRQIHCKYNHLLYLKEDIYFINLYCVLEGMVESRELCLETLSCTFVLASIRGLNIISFFTNLLTLVLYKYNDDGNPLGRYQQHSKISEGTGDPYKRGRFFLFQDTFF